MFVSAMRSEYVWRASMIVTVCVLFTVSRGMLECSPEVFDSHT